MRALVVVELEVGRQALPGLAWMGVLVQVDFFIFDRAPQPLGENVVERSAASIHTDLDTGLLQGLKVLRAGEVAALIAVPDDG